MVHCVRWMFGYRGCLCVSYCMSAFICAECILELQNRFVSGPRSWGWCVWECCTIRAAVLSAASSMLISMTDSLAWQPPSFYHCSGEGWRMAAWLSCLYCTAQGQSGMNGSSRFCLLAPGCWAIEWWPVAMVTDAYMFDYVVWVAWQGVQSSVHSSPL